MRLFNRQQGSAMDLVQITEGNRDRQILRVLFELLLTIALSVACWYTYFSMFPNPVDSRITAMLVVCLPAVLYLICRRPLLGRLMVFYIFLIIAIFFVVFYNSAWNGFMVSANIVVEVLNNEFNAGLIPFELTGSLEDWSRDTMMALIPVTLLSSAAIVYSVHYKEPLIGFIMTAIPTVTGLCLKAEPSIWLLALMLVCWTGLMVLSAVARPASSRRRRVIYIQNPGRSKLPVIFMSITMVLLLGYILAFSGEDYRPPESVDDAKAAAIAAEEHIRYERLGGDEIDRLGKGDLNATHPLEYTDNTVFQLKMQVPQPMYLRYFSGGSYSGGSWTEAEEGAYSGEYTGIMEWLEQQDFYPWMQQERLYRMSKNYDYASVEVTNVNGSSKYIYLPYEAAVSGDTQPDRVNYKKDYGAFARGIKGEREYSFEAFAPRMEDYDEQEISRWIGEVKQSSEWSKYAEPEAVYRRFVYDTYVYVPQKEYDAMKAMGSEKCQGKTISYILHYIRSTFDEEYTYDAEYEGAGKGRDELDSFLKNKRGNDMHFATAAALLFRCAGVPARYAEGYYMSPKAMGIYEESADVSYSVPDSYAHCWVEIYIDEIGWFPVEVIPGYYDMAKQETAEEEEQEKLEEKTNQIYEDQAPEESDPKKEQEKDPEHVNPLLILLLLIPALIIVLEIAGRVHVKRRWKYFETSVSDDAVYSMYRYVSRIMAFDKHKLPADPYDSLKETSSAYDAETGETRDMGFAEFVRKVSGVRFGGLKLSEEEHKKMAAYVRDTGSRIYGRQNAVKKMIMKFILFYV
ncbi:MAG: transglutaminase-like domain-containing protein [Lentihominibacter sp.]